MKNTKDINKTKGIIAMPHNLTLKNEYITVKTNRINPKYILFSLGGKNEVPRI